MGTKFNSAINGKGIFAKRAERTRGGLNLETYTEGGLTVKGILPAGLQPGAEGSNAANTLATQDFVAGAVAEVPHVPEITPAAEGKFLKVENGATAWGEGGGGGGDDKVYVDLGDLEAGIPVGQTAKWDEIAEHLVAGESVVGRVTSSSGTLSAAPKTQYSFAWLMEAFRVSTLADLKAICESHGMLDMLTILFGFEQDGATVKVDVTAADGIIPRYMMDGSTLEISEAGLNMDVSICPTNVYGFQIQDNKYVLDVSSLDDDIEELLRDIVSTGCPCKFSGWMGNTPGESTPSKYYGENIPAQIKLVEDSYTYATFIRIEVSCIALRHDPNVPYSELDTPVPVMWQGDFEFMEKHDHNRYWQTKDTAFELATVGA